MYSICSQVQVGTFLLQGSVWHSHLATCLPGCSRVPAMSFAIAVQFQQVLLKATFILEVQVNLQQSIARFKALQSCSEAAHRSMPAPAACWLKLALSSDLCLKAGGMPTQVWQCPKQHGRSGPARATSPPSTGLTEAYQLHPLPHLSWQQPTLYSCSAVRASSMESCVVCWMSMPSR